MFSLRDEALFVLRQGLCVLALLLVAPLWPVVWAATALTVVFLALMLAVRMARI